MAHFAKLDENNIVLEVHVVNDNDIQNLPFPESESVGQEFLSKIFPDTPKTNWLQTSYNNNFRVRYAGIGSNFIDSFGSYGGFTCKKPNDSFIFDETKCDWVPPLSYPTDDKLYEWDFTSSNWKLSIIQPPVNITIIE